MKVKKIEKASIIAYLTAKYDELVLRVNTRPSFKFLLIGVIIGIISQVSLIIALLLISAAIYTESKVEVISYKLNIEEITSNDSTITLFKEQKINN